VTLGCGICGAVWCSVVCWNVLNMSNIWRFQMICPQILWVEMLVGPVARTSKVPHPISCVLVIRDAMRKKSYVMSGCLILKLQAGRKVPPFQWKHYIIKSIKCPESFCQCPIMLLGPICQIFWVPTTYPQERTNYLSKGGTIWHGTQIKSCSDTQSHALLTNSPS